MLNKEMLAFDLGTYCTKVVLGKARKSQLVVKDAFVFPTPMGTVEDGQIINLPSLKEGILKKLDEKDIYTNKAVFTLASTKVITRELILPYVSEKKMAAMVPYELPKHLPITVDNYVIKHLTLDVFTEEKSKKSRVLVIALPKVIVRKYLDLCTELEIEPIALTVHGIGAAGFFRQKSLISGQMETVALIDLGHSGINCNIISEGKLIFNRIISTVGMKVSLDKLAKMNLDFSSTHYDKSLKEMVAKWLEEIKMVFRFYYSLENNKKIDQIMLIGGASNIPNIISSFEEKLDTPTIILRDNIRINYKGNDEGFALNQYFNAVSALSLN